MVKHMKKLILVLLIFTTFLNTYAQSENDFQESCSVEVTVYGESASYKKMKSWAGNYKIGFEKDGENKFETVELGKTYNFKISCYKTYISFNFDYSTHKSLGDLIVSIKYKKKVSDVRIGLRNCHDYSNFSNKGKTVTCSGFEERNIENIALR
jgi:hypothetical protein